MHYVYYVSLELSGAAISAIKIKIQYVTVKINFSIKLCVTYSPI